MGRGNGMSLFLHLKELKKVGVRENGDVVGFFLLVSNDSLLGLDVS